MGPTPDAQMKPDVVAVGGNDIYNSPDPGDLYLPAPSGVYMATQHYDPNSNSGGFGASDYSSNGYWAADGTSFATPLTAGAAALLKQAHASQHLLPTQIKSLLVNSASQVVATDDLGDPVDAEWLGAGLINAGAAIAGTITAVPSTISFGVLNSVKFPITKNITVTNIGTSAVTLSATVSRLQRERQPGHPFERNGNSQPRQYSSGGGGFCDSYGNPFGYHLAASEYSGAILLQQGATVVARIPFMMIEGDGVPYNVNVVSIPPEGAPGQDIGPAIVQVTDQYGVAVVNSPVAFSISPRGGISLESVSGEPACTSSAVSPTCNTDQFGFAYAEVVNGAIPQIVMISSHDCGKFHLRHRQHSKSPEHYRRSGSRGRANDGRSRVIHRDLWDGTEWQLPRPQYHYRERDILQSQLDAAHGCHRPCHRQWRRIAWQIDYVTVSFDVPSAGISVPGHIVYVSPTQVNVQVPWELQGQSSVQMKVSVDSDLFGNVVTVPLANAAPAFFSVTGVAIGTDLSGNVLTASNPAKRGQTIVLYAKRTWSGDESACQRRSGRRPFIEDHGDPNGNDRRTIRECAVQRPRAESSRLVSAGCYGASGDRHGIAKYYRRDRRSHVAEPNDSGSVKVDNPNAPADARGLLRNSLYCRESDSDSGCVGVSPVVIRAQASFCVAVSFYRNSRCPGCVRSARCGNPGLGRWRVPSDGQRFDRHSSI